MQANNQFYLHLPSDSSMCVYPDNTVAKYTTKLAKTIELDGIWEVGLAEILYPTDYYNIDNRGEDYTFGIKQIVLLQNIQTTQESYMVKRKIESALYYSKKDVISKIYSQINRDISERNIPATIMIDLDRSGRVNIIISRYGPPVSVITDEGATVSMFFELSEQFSKRFGFDKKVLISLDDSQTVRADHKFDLYMGKNLMYIYSDVVSYSLVGDVSVPLLRACNLPEPSTNNTIHLSFPDVHYKPVQKSHFDTISISINTEEGMVMPFQSGKVLVTLHFRRVNNLTLK